MLLVQVDGPQQLQVLHLHILWSASYHIMALQIDF